MGHLRAFFELITLVLGVISLILFFVLINNENQQPKVSKIILRLDQIDQIGFEILVSFGLIHLDLGVFSLILSFVLIDNEN